MRAYKAEQKALRKARDLSPVDRLQNEFVYTLQGGSVLLQATAVPEWRVCGLSPCTAAQSSGDCGARGIRSQESNPESPTDDAVSRACAGREGRCTQTGAVTQRRG